jgi:hypothetical protein
MATFKLKDVKPNPFRRTEKYPLIAGKVEFLKTSIENTDFWENIIGREVDGKLEIAYGHHRLEALKALYPPTKEFDWRVKKLSDAKMIQIMAAENDDAYSCDPRALIESVRATVSAYAKGLITEKEMPAPEGKINDTLLRHAPSFVAGACLPDAGKHPYTAITLGRFLGLTKKGGGGEQAATRLLTVLNALELNELGFLSDAILANCTTINSLEASMRQKDPLDVDVRSAIEKRDIKRAMDARKVREKEEAERARVRQEEERRKAAEARKKAEEAQRLAEHEAAQEKAQKEAEKEAKRKEQEAEHAKAEAKKKQDEVFQKAALAAKKKAEEAREKAQQEEKKRKQAEADRKAADEEAERAERAAQRAKEDNERKRKAAEDMERSKEKGYNEKREQEKKEEKKDERIQGLKVLIIKTGYKTLSVPMHPDNGGTKDSFAELGEARNLLLDLIKERN